MASNIIGTYRHPYFTLCIAVVALTVTMTDHMVNSLSTMTSKSNVKQKKELKMISFDLDDTLFPITETIQDANEVMLRRMVEVGADPSLVTQESIRNATVMIRRDLENPITYSELRTRAIEYELRRCCPGISDVASTAKLVFESWLEERQRAANKRLFPGVVECLKHLRGGYPDAKIVAITNGRGSPMEMPALQSLFDLCVSGEDDDVFPNRKPHRGIYEVALSKADLFPLSSKKCWIHVGDDLANDVGGSADCGAYAVLATVVKHEEAKTIFWSTASEKEMAERKRKDIIAQSKVSARIERISELIQVIDEIILS